jgi:hypothetical protein
MRRIVVVVAAAAMMVALVVAYAGVVMAQATTTTITATFPIEETFVNPCTGEPILITGTGRFVIHETTDANGRVHFATASTWANTSAENLETGEIYRVQTQGILAQNSFSDTPPYTANHVFYARYVSTDSSDNFYVRMQIHTTINANGEPTVVVFEEYAECRG